MTLQRQTLSIPIGVGQSEAEAAPYIQGNAATINARFDKRGRAAKRRPLDPVVAVPPANALAGQDGIPSALGTTGVRRLDPLLGTMFQQNTSEPRPSQAQIDTVLRGRRIALNPSVAVLQGVMCVCWTDVIVRTFLSRGGTPIAIDEGVVMYAFYDVSQGQTTLLSGPTQATLVRSAHVVALETGDATRCFHLIGEDNATALAWEQYVLAAGDYTFAVAGSFPFGVDRAIAGDGYDVCATDPTYGGTARAFTVWRTGAGGGGSYVSSIDAANTLVSYNDTTVGRTDGIAITHNPVSDVVYIGQLDGTVWGLDPSLSGATAGHSGIATLTPGLSAARVALGEADGSGGVVGVWSDRHVELGTTVGGTPSARGMHVATFRTGVIDGYVPDVIVIGKPLYRSSFNQSRTLIPVQTGDARRGFLLGIDQLSSPSPVGPYRSCLHASFSSALWCENNMLQTAPETSWTIPLVRDSDYDVHFVYPVVLTLRPGTTDPATIQLDHLRLRADQHSPVRQVKASDLAIYVGGAGAACIDGRLAADLTPQRPDPPFFSQKTADAFFPVGAGVSSDLYSISVGWGWIDILGREHRGPISRQLTTAWTNLWVLPTTQNANLLLAPLPYPTSLDGERGVSLFLDVYFSEANDPSIVRHVARLYDMETDPDYPDCVIFWFSPSGQEATILYPNSQCPAPASPSTIYAAPYTDSELEAEAPAALLDVVSTQRRLWALSGEARFSILTTKPIATGFAPEFSSALSVDVPQEGGECTGLAAIDDKVIVFKRDRVYVIVGDPGDANGNRSSLQPPRLLSSDVGCISTASIVEGPFGAVFQSERGMMLLTRGLELQPIGHRVEDQTAGRKSLGVLVPEEQEVRWFLVTDDPGARWVLDSEAVVWQYDHDEWSRWDLADVGHQAVLNGVIWSVGSGQVSREDTAAWATAGWDTRVTTPWIQTSGVEGFQRVWRLTALLYYYTGHVHVDVSYDYDDAIAETHTFLESVLTPLAAANGRCEISVRPSRQKCSAIRITIREQATPGQDPPDPTTGEGISLISVDAEIGVKSGTGRRRLAAEAKR